MSKDITRRAVIFDNGSGTVKCGFSGSKAPERIFKSIVGRPKHPSILVGMNARNCFVGDECWQRRGILRLKYPVEHGIVTNWNDMEKIWHHSFYNELKVVPSEQPVFLTESPLCPKFNREKMIQILFETFQVPKFHCADHTILTLFSYGKVSGVVLESGDGVTHTCPIWEGYHSKKKKPERWDQPGGSILRMNVGGRDVTDYLVKILSERGYEMTTSAERELVRDMKEKLCYCPPDFWAAQKECDEDEEKFERKYTLPDGSVMEIGSECFRAPQVLFCPSFLGSSMSGVHETLYNSIQKCDKEQRGKMFENIVLGGGNTMFPGFRERVETLMREMAPEGAKVEVHEREDRKYSSYIGASIVTKISSSNLKDLWVTKGEYDENGPSVVHRRSSPYEGEFSKISDSMLLPRKKDVDMGDRIQFLVNECLSSDDGSKKFEGVEILEMRIGENKFNLLKCNFV